MNQRSRRLKLLHELDKARQAKVVKATIKGTKAESREQVKHAAAERRGHKKRPRKGRAAQKHAQKHEQQPVSAPSSVAAVAKADYDDFHSAMVDVEIADAKGNPVVQAFVADLGSGPSFIQSRLVAQQQRIPGIEPEEFSTASKEKFVTEGQAMKGFKFVGCDVEYQHR